jgi:hypothetical protein
MNAVALKLPNMASRWKMKRQMMDRREGAIQYVPAGVQPNAQIQQSTHLTACNLRDA